MSDKRSRNGGVGLRIESTSAVLRAHCSPRAPDRHVKNGDDRVVVLNRVALSVIEVQRGLHPESVFAHRGQPIKHMLNSAWRQVQRSSLPQVRVHDLRHAFGRRLRAAGVSFEDRQDLLGHRSGRITTPYSAAELGRLIDAANTLCDRTDKPELVMLRRLNVG